jgi:hypothetical protein
MARFDEERFRGGGIVHRHDPANDDEVSACGPRGVSCGSRCRSLAAGAGRRCPGVRAGEYAAADEGEHEYCRGR